MSNHHHEIRVCACGAVVSQCRCMSKDKVRRVVRERCWVCVVAAFTPARVEYMLTPAEACFIDAFRKLVAEIEAGHRKMAAPG